MNAVKGDVFGIGYGGIAYLEGIRALKVKKDDTSPAVAPTLETAQSGDLPHQPLPLFLHGGRSLRDREEVHRLGREPRGPEGHR